MMKFVGGQLKAAAKIVAAFFYSFDIFFENVAIFLVGAENV